MKWISFFILIVATKLISAQGIFDPKPAKILKQTGEVLSLAFQPDDNALLIGISDKKCILWSLTENKELFSVPGLIQGAKACCYTKDKRYFLVASDRNVKIFYPNGEFVNQKGGPATQIWSFSVNQATNKIAFGSYDKNIRITDFTTGKLTTLAGHTKNALAVEYSPDNKILATGSLDATVKIWDAVSLQLITDLNGHGSNIYDLVFTPDSKKLLSASNDNTIRLWDLETKKSENVLIGNTKAVLCLSVSPDGFYLLSGSFDGSLSLWDIVRGELVYKFNEHTSQVNSVAFNNNGTQFVSGSTDNLVFVYDLKPELFIEKYYALDFKMEMDKSGLFLPKSKDESKELYKDRINKTEVFRKELVQKYYSKYIAEIRGRKLN